ncbi:MAG: phytanoyl-CoA dioxygenase family protein, partial [Pseudomonadota bacterium]
MANLTPSERTHYAEHGYVVPEFRLSADRVGLLRTTLDDLIAANPDVRPEKLVSAHIAGRNSEGVVGSNVFLDLAKDEDILDLVAQVIGDDIVLWGCHVFCKPGGTGFETPWHQDGHYWPITPLATCTVWVAIDDVTRENGCLQVIPGSHREKTLHAHMMEDCKDVVLTQSTSADAFDEDTAVALELEPGQMSLHDVFM